MLYSSQIIYFTSYKCYDNKIDEIGWISCGEIKTLPGMIRTDFTKEVTFKGGKWTKPCKELEKQMRHLKQSSQCL